MSLFQYPTSQTLQLLNEDISVKLIRKDGNW